LSLKSSCREPRSRQARRREGTGRIGGSAVPSRRAVVAQRERCLMRHRAHDPPWGEAIGHWTYLRRESAQFDAWTNQILLQVWSRRSRLEHPRQCRSTNCSAHDHKGSDFAKTVQHCPGEILPIMSWAHGDANYRRWSPNRSSLASLWWNRPKPGRVGRYSTANRCFWFSSRLL